MKYLIYARVSERGSGFEGETTIKMQIDYCSEYIKFHGGEIYAIRADEFCSGKDTNRPEFKQIMAELESGRAEWDTIIVYKLSRMTRSLKDGANIFSELFRQGKGFISATENLDFSSPAGRAMLGMMQVFNQFEREQTAENIRNKMMSIAAKGLWPAGNPPFGYRRGEKKDNRLYIDDRKAMIVRNVFEMYASDAVTTREIVSTYKHILVKSKILTILRDKVYIGKICYGGKEFDGQHPPIISVDLFEKVQRKLPVRKLAIRPKAYKYNFLLSGLLYCHCGRHLSAETAKSGDYAYYRCTDFDCKTRIRADKVEKSAKEFIKGINPSKKLIKACTEELIRRQKEHLELFQPELVKLKNAKNSLQKEKEKVMDILLTQKLNDSIISALNQKMQHIDNELEPIETKLNAISTLGKNNEAMLYQSAMEYLAPVIKMKDMLNKTDDTDILRRAFQLYIKQINLNKDGSYTIVSSYNSSTKGTEW